MRVEIQPTGSIVDVPSNWREPATLLDAAALAGIGLESVCGGRGTCGKCRVVASGQLSGLTTLEQRALSAADIAAGYRLACQAVLQGDAQMTVPPESLTTRVSILSEGVAFTGDVQPWVQRRGLEIPNPSLEDPSADLERLLRAWLPDWGPQPHFTLRALQQLPGAARISDGRVTLIVVDDEVVAVLGGDGPERLLGIAFDIGTTTVVGYLMDLESGEQLAVASLLNPQTRFGDDVVSRIGYATSDPDGLSTLQAAIIGAINHVIQQTTRQVGLSPETIYGLTAVGNTTMHHLLLGISPEALARTPYVPAVMDMTWHRASSLGIAAWPDAHVWVLPNIAGWVGADTVGVLLATGAWKDDRLALAIDIGTNGEMALGSRARMVTCSTAAGPAFEGAHLSCGMRAADGAIEWVSIGTDVSWRTVGGASPRGVCGSGLVDAVAEMLSSGVLDTTGMMRDAESLISDGRGALAARIGKNGKQRTFALVEGGSSSGGRAIHITQRDVRELQLAKGAIRAGIEILLKELGVGVEAVQRVYLAGAFGNYVRPESALGLGLMPRFPNAEIVPVGNAAGSGAKMALVSRSARAEAEQIRAHAEYLELSGRPDFQEEFAEAMLF